MGEDPSNAAVKNVASDTGTITSLQIFTENKVESVVVTNDDQQTEGFMHAPDRKCRCGCIPPDMMSLFEMAALRAKRRKEQEKLFAKNDETIKSRR